MTDPRQFEFMLNAFEQASQHVQPASVGYAEKRKAVLAFVRDLAADRERLMKRNFELAALLDEATVFVGAFGMVCREGTDDRAQAARMLVAIREALKQDAARKEQSK